MRVFGQTEQAEISGEEDGQLEEIDFTDIGKLQARVDAAASEANSAVPKPATAIESASFFEDTTPAPVGAISSTDRILVNTLDGALGATPVSDEEEIIVYVAPHPRTGKIPTSQNVPLPIPALPAASFRDADAAPPTAPSNAPATPVRAAQTIDTSPSQAGGSSRKPFSLELGTLYPELSSPSKQIPSPSPDAAELPAPPAFESVSFSFDKATLTSKKPARRLHPANTPRALLKRSRQPRRRPLRGSGFGFGSFGAAHEEAMLREVDPRRDERRRGHSDLEWGTDDEDNEDNGDDAMEALSAGMGGMELDEDIDLAAMKRFVHGMSAEGLRHVTMDDVADVVRMNEEDEQEDVRGPESASEDSEDEEDNKNAGDKRACGAGKVEAGPEESEDDDEEIEAVMNAEEELLIAEPGDGVESDAEDEDEDDEEEDDSEDEATPRRSFQARLEQMRASTRKDKGKGRATEDSSDEAMSIRVTWEDGEEEWLDSIDVRSSWNLRILLC